MGVYPVLALEAVGSQHATAGHLQPAIIKFNRNMPPNALQGRPDTDLVELSSGKRMKVGDIRRLTSIAHKNRTTAPKSLEPQALKLKPAATGGIAIRGKNDLQAAMQRPDSETVVLPSGKRTTVGMLRLLQPQVEERRQQLRVANKPRPDLSGPAVRISAGTDWYALLKQPDSTVLETAQGKRITVGELKQTLANSGKQPVAAPHIR
ncbi:MAG: hypothetical protein OEL57_16635 [Trichlorobacter sp.]|uniref:hypothetical protein n=1 Tax=Trichlorobacter sp. TaxID=2911007 RepID=UPI002561E018|nr:hypothetical protein [Trichlorobacter sp.]MDK9719510.1 hypothetical protein [Trichlorobacter sp.]